MTVGPALIETNRWTVSVPGPRSWPYPKPNPLNIVSDVSLAIQPGEIVCMVGESGSGKTTFGRSLVGLIKPSAGEISLDGQVLPDFSAKSFRRVRQETAILFQDQVSSFNPRQRIASIIAEPRRIAGRGDASLQAITELAATVGLAEMFLQRFPYALSGGQARRAAVARALSVVPRLIIADEPTAGLDVSVQGGVLNLFLDIRDALNTAFLLITHNLSIARHIADRVVILYLGRVVESGPAAQIFQAPRHPYTRALLDSEPVPDPKRRRTELPILGDVPSIAARPAGCEFHTRCLHAQPQCRIAAPVQQQISTQHSVACHFPLAPPQMSASTGLRLVSK